MPNFSSLARLEVPEKFLWWLGGVGGVCKVIFMSNPTVVLRLRLGWGFDNCLYPTKTQDPPALDIFTLSKVLIRLFIC